jgi:RHS repeat-associated protein
VRQKFTGKERGDAGSENSLDYFIARYYSGAQGRFTSPDPVFMTKQRIVDPQRWNLYPYVRNNPLMYVDPDGGELRIAIRDDSRFSIDVTRRAAERMAGTFRAAGVRVVSIEIQRGRVGLGENLTSGFTGPHYLEVRKDRAGSGGLFGTPNIQQGERGHNFNVLGGLSAIDTSVIGRQAQNAEQAAIGIANLGGHEVAHDVTPFHVSGDAVMDAAADDPNWLFNPGLEFGPAMQKALQKKYNKPGETPSTTILLREKTKEKKGCTTYGDCAN